MRNFDDYLTEEHKKEDSREKLKQEIVKANDGKYFCGNSGCADKTYCQKSKKEGACKYHCGFVVLMIEKNIGIAANKKLMIGMIS